MPVTIAAIGIVRDRNRLQRDEARGLSTASPDRSGRWRTRASARRRSARAIASSRYRHFGIATPGSRAREAAETRTARRSAEAEAAECERVADALYRDGF